MKSIHELLKLVLEHVNKHGIKTGLCYVIWLMMLSSILSHDEEHILLRYLRDNCPKRIKSTTLDRFYWLEGSLPPRLNWLDKHIKLTEPSIGKTDSDVFPLN